jgi:hypothetical protein
MSTSKGTVQKSPSNDEADKLVQVLEGLRKAHSTLGVFLENLHSVECFIGASKDILSDWTCSLPAHNDSCAGCEECEVISDSVTAWNLLTRAAGNINITIHDFKIVVGDIENIVLTAGGRLGV